MNKKKLIDAMSAGTSLSEAAVDAVINATTGSISTTLAKGNPVLPVGFGTLATCERARVSAALRKLAKKSTSPPPR